MFKCIQAARLAFVGCILGQLLTLVLGKWIWLDMRINVASLIPAFCLLGIVLGFMSKKQYSLKLPLIAQLAWVLVFLLLYRSDYDALNVIPGALLREGFGADFLSLEQINGLIIFALVAGNAMWIFPRKS